MVGDPGGVWGRLEDAEWNKRAGAGGEEAAAPGGALEVEMAEGPAQAVGTDDARGHPVLPGDCQLFTGCPQERRGRCWGACLGTAWVCPGEVWACPRRAGHVQVGCGRVQGGRGRVWGGCGSVREAVGRGLARHPSSALILILGTPLRGTAF